MTQGVKILPPEGQGPKGHNNTIEIPYNSVLFLQNIHKWYIYIYMCDFVLS